MSSQDSEVFRQQPATPFWQQQQHAQPVSPVDIQMLQLPKVIISDPSKSAANTLPSPVSPVGLIGRAHDDIHPSSNVTTSQPSRLMSPTSPSIRKKPPPIHRPLPANFTFSKFSQPLKQQRKHPLKTLPPHRSIRREDLLKQSIANNPREQDHHHVFLLDVYSVYATKPQSLLAGAAENETLAGCSRVPSVYQRRSSETNMARESKKRRFAAMVTSGDAGNETNGSSDSLLEDLSARGQRNKRRREEDSPRESSSRYVVPITNAGFSGAAGGVASQKANSSYPRGQRRTNSEKSLEGANSPTRSMGNSDQVGTPSTPRLTIRQKARLEQRDRPEGDDNDETYDDGMMSLEVVKKKSSKNNTAITPISAELIRTYSEPLVESSYVVTWTKNTPLVIPPDTEGYELLASDELQVCSTLRLLPCVYLKIKETLLSARHHRGTFRKRDAQSWCRVDVNKTGKIYDWFISKGWLMNPPPRRGFDD